MAKKWQERIDSRLLGGRIDTALSLTYLQVTTFEVASDAPHLFPLSPYKAAGLHQAISFLHKNVCNVRDVEFARAYRITNNTIEPVSFSVPRVKTAFFQGRVPN